MTLSCVLLQEATQGPLLSQVTAEWLTRCAAACQLQLLRDVAPVWGPVVTSVRVGSNSGDIHAGEMVFAIVDSLPNDPGAIAYHDVNGNEVPVAFLSLSSCSTLDDVSTAISHELCETNGDPAVNRWVDGGGGYEWALELCDAVESNTYNVVLSDGGAPITVSDFLLPSFFAPGATGPYNFTAMGSPSAPLRTASGGYQIRRTSGTGETAVNGSIRAHRIAKQRNFTSRLFRRGARV